MLQTTIRLPKTGLILLNKQKCNMKTNKNVLVDFRNPKGGNNGGNWPSTTGNPSGGGRGNGK